MKQGQFSQTMDLSRVASDNPAVRPLGIDPQKLLGAMLAADPKPSEKSPTVRSNLAGATALRHEFLHTMVQLFRTLKAMEVHFTSEQEAQLAQIATNAGIDAERLVKDAALSPLQEDARFRAAVREGLAQADRGEFIEKEDGRPPGADVAFIEMRIRWTPAAAV